jgi:hypothetical protein
VATGMHGAGGEYYHDRIGLPALDLGMSRERGSSCPLSKMSLVGVACVLACLRAFLAVSALQYLYIA